MKEHFQDQGVRKWAGDDLIELQSESLAALQGLVEPYAPCIIKGCEVSVVSGSNCKVSAGLVALPGNDRAGFPCVKIVRVGEIPSTVLPVYLTLTYATDTRVYSDGQSKEIAHDYVATVTTVQPENGSYLVIGKEGGPRLVDTLGISQKLDRDGGEAKDVKVSFAQASSRALPESGNKFGTIIGIARKWFADLKALAFKEQVSLRDLDREAARAFDNKVDKQDGKGLSANDFTDALKDKLDGIASGANNYSLPTASASAKGGITTNFPQTENNRAVRMSGTNAYVNVPNASASVNGLMTAEDKAKLDGIASGANNYSLPVASSSARGGIRTGYPSTRNERAVLLSSERAYVQIQNADHDGAGLMTSGDKIILDQLAKIRAVGMYQFQSNGTTYSSFGMTIYSNKGYASDGTICIKVSLTGGDTSKVYYPIAMAPIGYTVSISGRAAGGQVISLSFRKIGGGVEVPNGGYLYLFEAN